MMAHMEAPLPRWATTTRPSAMSGATSAAGLRHIRKTGREIRSGGRPPGRTVQAARSGRQFRDGRDERRCRSKRPAATAAVSAARRGWREIIGLMERSEADEVLEPFDYGVVDEHRLAVIRAAMHHPMADRRRQCSDLGAEKRDDLAKAAGRRHLAPGQSLIDQNLAATALGARVADARRCPRSAP